MKTGATALTSLAASPLKRAATAATGGAPAADFLHLIASTPSTAKAAKASKGTDAARAIAAPTSDTRPVAPAAKADKTTKSKDAAAASDAAPNDNLKTADGKPDSGPPTAEIVKTDAGPAHESAHEAAFDAVINPQGSDNRAAHDGKAEAAPKTIAKPHAGDALSSAHGTADGDAKLTDDNAALKPLTGTADVKAAESAARTPIEPAVVPAPVTRTSAKIAEKPKVESSASTSAANAAEKLNVGDTATAAAVTEKPPKATPAAKPAATLIARAGDAEPAAATPEPVKIPGAAAAAFVTATGAAATASVTPATSRDDTTAPAPKAKAAREPAAPPRKDARAETGEKTKPDAERAGSIVSAVNENSTKPAERQQASTPATELPSRETGMLRTTPSDPGTQTLSADVRAASDIRLHLPRDTSHAGATAPVVAIRVHAKDGVTRAIEIRLDPDDLGQVDVRLETGHDGRLRAVVQADNPQTFELLKREGATLEAALRDAGVQLGDDGLSFTLGDQGTGSDSAHQRERSYAGAAGRREDAIQDVAAANWRDGVVDISV